MIFERLWVLLLLALPAGWLLWEWRRSAARAGLLLKALSFAAILLALAEPVVSVPERRVELAVLVDTSASVSDEDLRSAADYAGELQNARGRHLLRIVPFAGGVREAGDGTGITRASGEVSRATNLEAAMRHAAAGFSGSAVPRMLLMSDGLDTQGSAVRAAWLARQMRIPVDVVPFAGRVAPRLRLENVVFPAAAFTGERFPIDIVVQSPEPARGTVELLAEGRVIGRSPVELKGGDTPLRVFASFNVAGAVDISGRLAAGALGEVQFEQAVTLRRPRLLYVSQDPPGSEANLLAALRAGEFEIQTTGELPQSIDAFQVVVLNNQDLEHYAPRARAALEQFVRNGGGLLVIGGERNLFDETKKQQDALDRALPAKLAPPRTAEGTCVVLIVDKSSSMEGRKMELARLSAIGVIENLRPVDMIGVLIFDNSWSWAVPIRRAEDRSTLKRIVAGIMPDGGTQIAPALAEAYRRTVPVNATYKHIVLLTDGISEEGDAMQVSGDAARQKVTISTVGLGQDVNRSFLEKVAANAKGKSYFLVDPSGLEQILLKDVMEHTGSTAVEKQAFPVVMAPSDVLNGIDTNMMPGLKGYVRYIAHPDAETVLAVERKDPLFVAWQHGLGRAAIWASDAKSRWAEGWIGWPGYDRFWLNVARNLLPKAAASEAAAWYDAASGSVRVEYRFAPNAPLPDSAPELFVIGPGGLRRPVELRRVAERVWAGAAPVPTGEGLFRIRPLAESRFFPETGFHREEREMRRFGNDESTLRMLAAATGGRYAPRPREAFAAGARPVTSSVRLWPGLLAAAILLSLGELALRKLPGMRLRRASAAL